MTQSTSIEIRVARVDDLAALVGLLAELHPDFPSDPATAPSVLRAILSQDGRTLLVALSGGEVVGTADLLIVPNLTHAALPWAIVENVVVARRARRTGVGRALMSNAIKRAVSAGCYMVQLVSLKHRHDAHRFYNELGFEPVAEGFRLYMHGFVATGVRSAAASSDDDK